jgi:serine protease Do
MRTTPVLTRFLASLAVVLLLGACQQAESQEGTQHPDAARLTDSARTEPINPTAGQELSRSFRAAAQQALPSVVFVRVRRTLSAEDRREMNPFDFFFGPQGPEGTPDGQIPPQVGSGSGFIFDAEGHVITNHHVIEGADLVVVRLVDGQEYDAEVIGSDPQSDVAVLQIEERGRRNLPVARIGSSDPLQVGDWVLALGSPLELEATVTAGIVSAKRRQLTTRESSLEAFIQTDAAINPGNSGGPLVDLTGSVVGINSAILGGRGFIGYGFAIPIDLAKKVVDDILEFGEVRRPQLGVQIQAVSAADAEVYELPEIRGAEIVQVVEDSPAERAGLQLGDVVMELDGDRIDDPADLTTTLAEHQPGDEVELTLYRDGRARKITVELGRFDSGTDEPEQSRREGRASRETLGFHAERLTPALARSLGLERTEGVVITEVAPFSAPASVGVQVGQVLLRINRQEISSPQDVEEIAEGIEPGQVVSLRVIDPNRGETIINYRVR